MRIQEHQAATIEKLEKDLALKNRELEIQLALEKVRERTMTMQKSEELLDKPLVSVRTRTITPRQPAGKGAQIEIRVIDNGNGIAQTIVDKIFQPFFTTKPTGEGTGLGLSLSYDIIKAHGGEIKVESTQGEGSTLIINLPV